MPLDTTPATEDPDSVAAKPADAGAIAAPAAAPVTEATTPPTPETPAEPKSALEAALKALDKGRDPAAATAAQPAGETVQPDSTQPAQPEDDQDESLADVPKLSPDVFRALPKEARSTFNALRKQAGTLRPDAERGQAVAKFLTASGISPEEFAEMQDVGALMKRDPAKAREVLIQHLDRIDTFLGLKLPDDLKKEVDGGYISEDRAAELSRERAARARLESTVAARTEADAGQAMVSAVSAWETETRRTDLDLDRKLPSIQREVKLILTERAAAGNPVRTPEEAVQVAQEAHKRVDEMLKPFRAAAAPTPRVPSSVASSAPASAPAPSSALDAAYAGLRRAGRG